MAYFAPYIDETGLHYPSYTEIRDAMVANAQSIFGMDIYLEPDSQDYQYISAIAQYVFDAMQVAQYVYNSRGPSTAIGSGLDGVAKLNGLKRKAATYSTATVDITGTAGTIITNGVVQDVNGNTWNLPATVTIGAGGSISVIATAETAGAIIANAGEITTIVTPTYGWTSVTNPSAADVGTNIETDDQMRARQAVSTAQASQAIVDGIYGAILGIAGVTRAKVYENFTHSTDSNGQPAHSIACVVENGLNQTIADTIFLYKSPGCSTYGTTQVPVIDSKGVSNLINFFRPTYVDIDVTINVKQLPGYTSSITAAIRAAVVDYLNSLEIGADLSVSALWGAALQATPDLKTPLFSITGLTAAKHGQSLGTADIVIAYNESTRGNLTYITVNVT